MKRLVVWFALLAVTISAAQCLAQDQWSVAVSDPVADTTAVYDIVQASAWHDGGTFHVEVKLAGQYSTDPYTAYGAMIRVPGAVYVLAFVTAPSFWGPKLGVSYDGGISWNYAPGSPSGSISPTQIDLQVPMSDIGARPWDVSFMSGVWWYFNGYQIMDSTSALTAPPYLTPFNIVARQRTDGSHKVDIEYELWSAAVSTAAVSLNVSSNGGASYDIIPNHVSGDVGAGIRSGGRRHIVWDAGRDLPGAVGADYKVQLTASPSVR